MHSWLVRPNYERDVIVTPVSPRMHNKNEEGNLKRVFSDGGYAAKTTLTAGERRNCVITFDSRVHSSTVVEVIVNVSST